MLDKSMAVVDVVAAGGPQSLADLVRATGGSRATVHRLAVALEVHGLLRRDDEGRFALGLRLLGLGRRAAEEWPVAEAARPILAWLRERTGESVQLYVRDGDERLCVAALDSPHELRTIVPVGSRLPLGVGSAGRVLGRADAVAATDGAGEEGGGGAGEGGGGAGGGGGGAAGRWVASVEERAPGVASVSAGAWVGGERVALSVSGPVERLGRDPGGRFGPDVATAADRLAAVFA